MTRTSSVPIYADTSPTTPPFTQILTLCETLRREAVHLTAGLVLGHLRDFGTIVIFGLQSTNLDKVLRADHRVSLIIH
jgi:hypothetical protein